MNKKNILLKIRVMKISYNNSFFPDKSDILKTIKESFLSSDSKKEEFFRFEFNINTKKNIDLLSWLKAQKEQVKIYFSDKNGNEAAGIGVGDIINNIDSEKYYKVDELNTKSNVENLLKMIENRVNLCGKKIRYYGAYSFDAYDHIDSVWSDFGSILFIVPLVEILQSKDKKILAVNFYYNPFSNINKDKIMNNIESAIKNIHEFSKSNNIKSVKLLSRNDSPGRDRWLYNVLNAINSFKFLGISKIVLARKSIFKISEFIDPVIVFSLLKKRNTQTYDFFIQIKKNEAFFGCSPELLFHRRENMLISDAIAGTISKGRDGKEEKSFANRLLTSKKDSEEFGFVFRQLKKVLKKICTSINISNEKEVLTLSYAQHLRCQFKCTLKDNVNDLRILKVLHPTPAVSGFPVYDVFKIIKRYEYFYRGFYSGPVGWFSKNESCFAVGLRSGVMNGRYLSVFAGAGIVKRSSPELEWNEIENKIEPFLKILDKKKKVSKK